MIEIIREVIEYKVTKNHLFTLGNLIRNMLKDGWFVVQCIGKEDGEYITFER